MFCFHLLTPLLLQGVSLWVLGFAYKLFLRFQYTPHVTGVGQCGSPKNLPGHFLHTHVQGVLDHCHRSAAVWCRKRKIQCYTALCSKMSLTEIDLGECKAGRRVAPPPAGPIIEGGGRSNDALEADLIQFTGSIVHTVAVGA